MVENFCSLDGDRRAIGRCVQFCSVLFDTAHILGDSIAGGLLAADVRTHLLGGTHTYASGMRDITGISMYSVTNNDNELCVE